MEIIEIKNWAVSPKGRSISCFKSTAAPQKPLIIIGGVHGDEPEGVELANQTLNWIREFNTSKKLIPWVLIPCLNPDGFTANERTNGNGVDLNRNYPSKDWSPESAKPRYYPGPHPKSEPEIVSLVQLIDETSPRMIIHFHSWQPCIVYAGPPALPAAQALSSASGYEVRDDIGYPTPGSLSRFGWSDNKIPIICVEEQEHTPAPKVWPRFQKGIIEILQGKWI